MEPPPAVERELLAHPGRTGERDLAECREEPHESGEDGRTRKPDDVHGLAFDG
jgi:hypothetical protein